MKPLVSVVIPNLNGRSFLEDCLESLKNQTYQNLEIILVDNGSTDGSVEFVRERFPEVKVVVNGKNLGFARPNNQGFERSRGEYIATLNNDAKADRQWLENLAAIMGKDNKIGMCASKILSLNEPRLIDSAGVNICYDGSSQGRGRGEKDDGQYDKIEEVLLPSGCAALYRRRMLEEVGFFDEDFFAFCEDTDLGIRGRLAGWRASFCPEAVVYHAYSKTTGGSFSPLKAFLVERNHFWLVVKNFPVGLIILYPFLTFWRYWWHLLSLKTKRGSASKFTGNFSFWQFPSIVLRAYFSAFCKLPAMLKKRSRIKKQRKISGKEFYALLKKFNLPFKELALRD